MSWARKLKIGLFAGICAFLGVGFLTYLLIPAFPFVSGGWASIARITFSFVAGSIGFGIVWFLTVASMLVGIFAGMEDDI